MPLFLFPFLLFPLFPFFHVYNKYVQGVPQYLPIRFYDLYEPICHRTWGTTCVLQVWLWGWQRVQGGRSPSSHPEDDLPVEQGVDTQTYNTGK